VTRNAFLVATLVLLFSSCAFSPVLSSVESSKRLSSYGIVRYPTTIFSGKGVNYLSLAHMYKTSNEILRRDFLKFQRDGINVISLSLYWYRLEGNTRGDYDGVLEVPPYGPYGDRFLDDILRIIGLANEYDIKVLVTFHTFWGKDSTWCTPDYVIDPVTGLNIGLAIVRSDGMRQAFIDMFTHAVQYLAGTEGIWAWALLNEPWYWPHELPSPYENIDQKENFITLFENLSNIVKKLDGRPCTIRFSNAHVNLINGKYIIKNIFEDDFGWDPRIFDALDFVGFNFYGSEYPKVYDSYLKITKANVEGCHQRNKRVWITEFGVLSDDDSVQLQGYKKSIEIFYSLQLDGWISWYWESDNSTPNISFGQAGKGMNVCANATTGEGRPAYYELATSNPKL